MARLDVAGLQAGSRVDMGEKRNPTDFALWKFSAPGSKRQMEWDSPWGTGFPGWHIECSAMAVKYLGPLFDIHCGGEDHVAVHHSNEIAQTEACHQTRLANFWMHGCFLQLDSAKMAKATGGFVRLETVIERGYDPMAYRFFCLGAHYRAKLNLTWESLDGAATALERLRAAAHEWGPPGEADKDFVARFVDQVNDDLNMPRALAVTWDLVRADLPPAVRKATLLEFDRVLGLRLAGWRPRDEAAPDEVMALVRRREEARAARRFKEADALRDEIAAAGWQVEDLAGGPRVRRRRTAPGG